MENNIKLLVTGIGRNRYAIRDEDVQSVHEIQRVHRIPFAPSTFAGISSIDGAMTRLFDLPACLGHDPLDGSGEGQALAFSSGNGKDAFLVKGGLTRIEVKAESLFPMPPHLTSPVLEYCILHSGRLMPVVNIENLYRRLLEGNLAPPACSLPKTFHKDRSSPGSAGKGVAILKVGGETFAIPDSLAAHKAIRLPRLVDMPLAPPYVPGIVYLDGKVWTVLDPSVRLNTRGESAHRSFLPLGGKPFGLLLHGTRGRLDKKKFNIQPLPSPFKSDLLNSVIVSKNEIVPFLETGFLPTDRKVEFAEVKYRAASKFRAHFKKKLVKVLIFELAGQRFGVPASQVETEAAALPFRSMPSSRAIAVGVTQWNELVLPVLDLARCFGEQSRVGPGWRMIQLKNGNFRGLLLAERVLGEISLPPESQIALPICLSSKFVHGCFLQDEALRLILDIEALVTHFKHDQVADSFRYLTMRKWKEEDLLNPGFTVNMNSPLSADEMPKEETPGADSPVEAHPDQHPWAGPGEKKPDDERKVTPYPASAERSLTVEEESTRETPQADPLPEEDNLCEPTDLESDESHRSSPEVGLDLHQENNSEPESPEPAMTDEAEALLPSDYIREPEQLEKPVQPHNETADNRFPRTHVLTTDPEKDGSLPEHGDEPLDLSDTEGLVADTSGESEDSAPDRFIQPKIDAQHEPSFEESDDAAARASEPHHTDKKSETLLNGGLFSVGSERVRIPPFRQDTNQLRNRVDLVVETSKEDKAEGQSGRRKNRGGWLALLILLLLVAGGYLFSTDLFQRPTELQTTSHEQSVVVEPSETNNERQSGSYEIRENPPGGVEPKMFIADDAPSFPSRTTDASYPKETPVDGQTSDPSLAIDPAEFAAVEVTSNETGMSADMPMAEGSGIESPATQETPPSLILEFKTEEGTVSLKSVAAVPDGAKPPAGSRIHVVERGDTLWDIAERFTGNPFNYPSLASASGVENPDLIYPGQQIAIVIARSDN